MTKAENLSKAKILSELKRYKKAYGIAMDNFDKWDNETKQDVHEQLDKIDLYYYVKTNKINSNL